MCDLHLASIPGDTVAPSCVGSAVLRSSGEGQRCITHKTLFNFGRYLEIVKPSPSPPLPPSYVEGYSDKFEV